VTRRPRRFPSVATRRIPLFRHPCRTCSPVGRGAGLELVSIADERAAAFFALGQGRATGRPTTLICTSGSAPAHFLPAILEAREAGVPLIALTADRPFELMDCAAPQTTDQTKLFGSAVRLFAEIDLGGPADPRSLRAIRRAAALAVFRSRWPRPGAVHVNVRARKPLEPPEQGDRALAGAVDALLDEPLHVGVPAAEPCPAALDRAAVLCRQAERGLIVAGPLPLSAVTGQRWKTHGFGLVELALRTSFPLLAEVTSQGRRSWAGTEVSRCAADSLGSAREAAGRHLPLPDLVVQVGGPPVSAGTQRLLAAAGAPRIVISDGPWTDPDGFGAVFLIGDVERTTRELSLRLSGDWTAEPLPPLTEPRPGERELWRRGVRSLCARFREAANREATRRGARFHDGQVARAAVAATPPGGLLMLGNSLPVRVVETWAGRPEDQVRVASQRGLSGIDGLVAGFLGTLSTGEFPAGVLLLGDVRLLHDLDALAIAPEYAAGPPAVVVVIDNQGGRIFERLPIASTYVLQGPEGRHWLTPHAVDFEGLGQAFGLPYSLVEDRRALHFEIEAALARRGVSLVVARVDPGALAEAERSLERAMASSG